MTGLLPMLGKEISEIIRTWRGWLVLAAFALLGIADPILARYARQLISLAIGDQLPSAMPDPSWPDAWTQWTKDLSQLLIALVIVVAAAAVAAEIGSGTAIMPLTKPLGRSAFVLAKYLALLILVAVGLTLGTALASVVTSIVFPGAELAPGWRAAGAWGALAAFYIALTICASCLVANTVAGFGIGFAAYLLISGSALWPPARDHSPAGLGAAAEQLGRGQPVELAWPLTTAILGAVLLVGAAIIIFGRREL